MADYKVELKSGRVINVRNIDDVEQDGAGIRFKRLTSAPDAETKEYTKVSGWNDGQYNSYWEADAEFDSETDGE